ncbi:MAG: hypothetical protein R2788_23515 [Saprospiraceae bacterium]
MEDSWISTYNAFPQHHPHPELGIGQWSEADFYKAVKGRHPAGWFSFECSYATILLLLDSAEVKAEIWFTWQDGAARVG